MNDGKNWKIKKWATPTDKEKVMHAFFIEVVHRPVFYA